jgi:hypothetical protein
MPEPDRLSDHVTRETSRRGFLERVGKLLLAATAGDAMVSAVIASDAQGFHFCGHTYTTGSCPHPTGLPRVDARGYPLRARDGHPVDDLGRLVDRHGRPVGEDGGLLRDPDGRPLPEAPRSRVCAATGRRYGMRTWVDGSWYRCCGGQVRKLMDCCSYSSRRINGDSALAGYCYGDRKVFCVHYYDTRVPC